MLFTLELRACLFRARLQIPQTNRNQRRLKMRFEIPVLAFVLEFHYLALFIGWIVAALVGAFALVIIYKMLKGVIDLKFLIAGDDGDASLSRFQFLIFTFVIALSLFLIIINRRSEERRVGKECR